MSLYDILGVKKTDSEETIKKAFKEKAKQTHPDHSGNEEEFKEILKAYKVLSDPETRGFYDRTKLEDFDVEEETLDLLSSWLEEIIIKTDIERTNIIKLLEDTVTNQINYIEKSISDCKKVIQKITKMIERLSSKNNNILIFTILNQKREIEKRKQVSYNKDLEITKKVYETLNDYEYRIDYDFPVKMKRGGKVNNDFDPTKYSYYKIFKECF